MILGDNNATAHLAVKDLNRARKFYEDALGLKPVDEEDGEVIVYKSGDTKLNVYRSDFAGTNKATAVTWSVGDELEDVIRDLHKKGVSFEHYEMPGMTVEGDVHRHGILRSPGSRTRTATSSVSLISRMKKAGA